MTRTLPPHPSLEQLKNQAKDLLKACRSGDPTARSRLSAQLPGIALHPASVFSLANAQYVVAHEYGFASWPKLKQHLQTVQAATLVTEHGDLSPATRQRHAHLLMMAEHMRRRPEVVELTEHVLALAAGDSAEALVERLSRMPARLILAIRANVLALGTYVILVDGLIAGLEHPRAKVRQQAAQALDLLADDHCVLPLRRALEDPVPRVRRTAFHAISCDECKIAPLHTGPDPTAARIEHALYDTNMRVRRDVTAGLGEICDDERVVAALQMILNTETDEVLTANARRALTQQQRGRA